MEKKGIVEEFKAFISRGNVLDMAVGVIVGGAFTSIVNSLVNDILMPIVGGITGGLDFTAYSFHIGEASINYGSFIQAVVNFLIVAWVIFLIVKGINSMRNSSAGKLAEIEAKTLAAAKAVTAGKVIGAAARAKAEAEALETEKEAAAPAAAPAPVEAEPAAEAAPVSAADITSEEIQLLREIRDALKK